MFWRRACQLSPASAGTTGISWDHRCRLQPTHRVSRLHKGRAPCIITRSEALPAGSPAAWLSTSKDQLVTRTTLWRSNFLWISPAVDHHSHRGRAVRHYACSCADGADADPNDTSTLLKVKTFKASQHLRRMTPSAPGSLTSVCPTVLVGQNKSKQHGPPVHPR